APPAAVEAEEQEDRELDRDDEDDRAPEQRVVVDGEPLVEAELEGEHPRDRDDPGVRDELEEPVAADPAHRRADESATAERTVSTTRSCASAGMPGQSGNAMLSAAARSVSGSAPGA